MPAFEVPGIEEIVTLTAMLGRRTNPAIRCAGVSFNTSGMDEGAAMELMAKESDRLGLPVADPIRGGAAFDRLVDACLAWERNLTSHPAGDRSPSALSHQ